MRLRKQSRRFNASNGYRGYNNNGRERPNRVGSSNNSHSVSIGTIVIIGFILLALGFI